MPDAHGKYQSLRLACDRCRSYKLKCHLNKTSTNAGACERCLRAKVQCNFSPRARTGRPLEQKLSRATDEEPVNRRKRRRQLRTRRSSDARSYSSKEGTPNEDLSDARLSVSRGGLSNDSTMITDMPDPQLGDSPSFPFLPASSQLDIADLDNSTFNLDAMVALISETEMGTFAIPDPTMINGTPTSLDETQFETTPALWDIPHELDFLADMPGMTDPDLPSARGPERPDQGTPPPSCSNRDDGDDCARKLSTLALAFHRHLSMVNRELWGKYEVHQNDQECLTNYPIGDIINLSHELINVLRSVSLNASFHPEPVRARTSARQAQQSQELKEPAVQDGSGHQDGAGRTRPLTVTWPMSPASDIRLDSVLESGQESSQVDIDTPTTLLILNCYVSLIQILTAVFDRLHRYLHSLPSLGSPGTVLPRLPGLQFGELPSSSDDAYTRTHAAYQILLDILGRSENILNLPPDFRCVRVRENDSVRKQPKQRRHQSLSSEDGQASNGSGGSGGSGGSSIHVGETEPSLPLVEMKLVEAVWQHEAWSHSGHGAGGGLSLLRQNIRLVKLALRQKMAL